MPDNVNDFDDFPGEWPDNEDSLFWHEFMQTQLKLDELYEDKDNQ